MQVFHIYFVPHKKQLNEMFSEGSATIFTSFLAEWNNVRPTGDCDLPYRFDDIPVLVHLFENIQIDPYYYLDLDETRKEILSDYGLIPKGKLIEDVIKEIGYQLYKALFINNPEVDELFKKFLESAADNPAQEHRLVLHFNAVSRYRKFMLLLLQLPWEVLLDPEDATELPLAVKYKYVIVMRSYQRNHSSAPASTYDPLIAPTIVLLQPKQDNTHQLEHFGTEARPQISYSNLRPIWCNILDAPIPLTLETFRTLFQQYNPHILHYFGHGEKFDSQFSFLIDQELTEAAQPYGTRLAWLDFREHQLRLFAIFACHSASAAESEGKRADNRGARQNVLEQSLVSTLFEHLPTVLAMQTLMPMEIAVQASQQLYKALADGLLVTQAVQHMREHLYRLSQTQTADLAPLAQRAWWVPVLYVSDPTAEHSVFTAAAREAGWALQPWGIEQRTIQRVDLIKSIVAERAETWVFGQKEAGKTAFLRQVLLYLQQTHQQAIAFCSCESIDSKAYIQIIQREIVCRVRQIQALHVTWMDAAQEYESVARSYNDTSQPIFVLIDDIDLFSEEERGEIMEPLRLGAFIIICTTSTKYSTKTRYSTKLINLPDPTAQEKMILNNANFDDVLREEFDDRLYNLVKHLIFSLYISVSIEDIHNIVKSNGLSSDYIIIKSYVDRLKKYVDEQNGIQPINKNMYDQWHLNKKEIYTQLIVPSIARWRDSQKIEEYPDILLRILAHPVHRRYIDSFCYTRDSLEREPPYKGWYELARVFYVRNYIERLDELLRYRVDEASFPYTPLDRAVLSYLRDRIDFDRAMYQLYDSYIWETLVPNPQLLAQWQRTELRPGDHKALLFRLTLAVKDGLQELNELLRQLWQVSLDDRCFGLRFLIVPLLKNQPTVLERLIEQVDQPQRVAEKLALGSAIAEIFGTQLHLELTQRILPWLADAIEHDPEAASRFFCSLLTTLSSDDRRTYAHRLLERLPTDSLYGRLSDPAYQRGEEEGVRPSQTDDRVRVIVLHHCAGSLPELEARIEARDKKDFDFILTAIACAERTDRPVLIDSWQSLNTDYPPPGRDVDQAGRLDTLATYLRCCSLLGYPRLLPKEIEQAVHEDRFFHAKDWCTVTTLAHLFLHNERLVTVLRKNLPSLDNLEEMGLAHQQWFLQILSELQNPSERRNVRLLRKWLLAFRIQLSEQMEHQLHKDLAVGMWSDQKDSFFDTFPDKKEHDFEVWKKEAQEYIDNIVSNGYVSRL